MLVVNQEEPIFPELEVWPNPAREMLYLSLAPAFAFEKELTIQLFSLSGRLVRRWEAPFFGDYQELGLEGIPSGAYLLLVESGSFARQQLVAIVAR